jgi:hypothetical protein
VRGDLALSGPTYPALKFRSRLDRRIRFRQNALGWLARFFQRLIKFGPNRTATVRLCRTVGDTLKEEEKTEIRSGNSLLS